MSSLLDMDVEQQVWAQTWNELQRSAGYSSSTTDAVPATNEQRHEVQRFDAEQILFEWARRVYRPVLALKVWRGESIVGAYLLFGEDQTRDYVAEYSKLDDAGIALADVLRPQTDLLEDVTRSESLRRLSWVMHQLNGPVGRAKSALEDVIEFLNDHPDLARMFVPNDEKARRRASMPGNAPLDRQTLNARLQDAMKAVADVRKIAYQVRRLRRVQGDLPKSLLDLSQLLQDRSHSCREQLPRLNVECDELAEISVFANTDSIREAIDEVLSNSCRELRERCVDDPKLIVRCWSQGDTAWISITDNALPETVRLIFDPFEEDASTYAASGRGTGLGLAIVRETFRAHGGSCSLTENFTEEGRAAGITFVGSLPLNRANTHTGAV
jgi:signal transduction histidine kinase